MPVDIELPPGICTTEPPTGVWSEPGSIAHGRVLTPVADSFSDDEDGLADSSGEHQLPDLLLGQLLGPYPLPP
jgi:hypothetical protein